jgi:hypothetical protein
VTERRDSTLFICICAKDGCDENEKLGVRQVPDRFAEPANQSIQILTSPGAKMRVLESLNPWEHRLCERESTTEMGKKATI